ncbi:MAG: helix-turn-helix transcriptional regulator [Chitinophagaceae bacterium]|nr:helix-turn-helix transcriptional regulator [Chitinophagaceae bacterium]
MNYQLIGENIKRHRIFKGKKQQVFAEEIGVSRIMMSRYENGHTEIGLVRLSFIALKLGISLSELLGEKLKEVHQYDIKEITSTRCT